MARLTAPVLSLRASGSIAKALVFAHWKGIPYARVHVIPANPQSVAQQEVRGVFSTLNEMFKRMPAVARLPWDYAVRGRPLTARNKFIQDNLALLIDEATLIELLLSVGSGQAIATSDANTFDSGDGTVTVTGSTSGGVPPGYTEIDPWMFAVLDGEPGPGISRRVYTKAVTGGGRSGVMPVEDNGVYYGAVVSFFTRDADSLPFAAAGFPIAQTVTGA